MVSYSLISWVPSTKRTNNEGIEKYTISLSSVVLRQRGIFLLLFLSCSLEGSITVLKWHGDVYNGHRLTGFVDCDKVRSARPIKARNRMIDSNSGGGRSIKGPHSSVLDSIVAFWYGHEVWYAMA